MDIIYILINAIVVASIYGLVAVAVSITWSSLGLINLGYGFVFSFAGYGAWLISKMISENPLLVAAAGIGTGALGGILMCLIVFIPLHDKQNFTARGMIATLAISLIGSQGLLMYFGPRPKSLPEIFGFWKIEFGGVVLTSDKIGIVACSVLMLVVVVLWMRSSRRGLEVRAMMMNPHAASIVGIGIRSTGLYVMAMTGAITTAALSGGKIGLIADKDINLQGSVTALDRFLAKSDEADVHVGSFYYKVDVTAAAVSLSAGDKVFVHQSVVDARGSAEFGIKGDLFIHSNDDIIVESKHWHDTRVEERQNYKKTIWDNKNIISELKASNDIGLFSKEGDFDFKSSKMTAGNGIVGSFGGGISGAARQHGEAYELYQDGHRTLGASGHLPVQIIATSNSLASREKLDVDTLDRLSAEEAENGMAKFREISGKGNIVLRANDSVIMNGPKIKSDQIVNIHSKEGELNMSDVPIFGDGYNGGELTHSINPGDWNIVGYYTSEIYGDEGVQLLAPNGAVTLYGGHIMSGNGNVVLAGQSVNLKPTTNVTQFTTSSASGGLFSSSTFSSSFYQESSNPSVVIAGGDLLISGTQGVVLDTVYLQSGDDMLLTAGYGLDGNLVMADASVVFNASKDVTHMSQSSSETGLFVGSGESWFSLFGHESSSKEAWMENVSASQAIAGGNLVIKASGDIYSEAAQLAAVGNVGLEAGGNITLSTVVSESWMQMSSYSWSFGIGATLPDFPKSASFSIQAGLQASNSGTNLWNLTHVGTQIAAGTSDNPGNVVMLSGGDTTIEGSVVTATGNIMIDAEGNVTIADVHNQSEIENYSDYTFVGFTIGLSNPALDAVSAAYNSFTSLQTAIEDAQSGLQNVNDPLSAISGAASIAQVFNATQNFQNSLTTLQGEVEKYAAFVKKDQNGLEELVLLNIDASFGIEHSSNFTNTQSTTSQGSALFANGNISIDTALDFNFIGSDIAAGGDVGINAGGSVNLVNGTDTTESQTGSNSFEFNVGLTASINGVLQGSIGSFYANANFQVSQGNSGATTSVPATILGTNVAINAGGDITGVGTLIGGENIYLTAGENISFLAAENSSFSSGNSFGAGFGVTAPVMAGNITGYGFSFDTNISQSQSSSSTFVNSLVSATGELEVTSGGDTNLIGAIFQGKDVVLDVGGNLNIESLQSTAHSSSFGLNLGFGLGTNAQFKPTNVSFDFGIKGQAASMAWVEQQSGIIGSGSVNVTVGGNTDLVGGVISSGGPLTLDTGSLTFSNIYDHKFSAGGFFNLGNLTYEFGSSDTLATQFADHFNILTGKWDAGFEFYDIRQTTSATISGGSVTINGISGLPSGLNTNIALGQQITSNVSIDAMSLISDIREIYKARENFNTLLSAQ